MRHIALLGSTGSIGRSALEVISANGDQFEVVGMAAGENIDLLIRQIGEFDPDIIAVKQAGDVETVKNLFPQKKIFCGREGLLEVVSHPGIDTVVSAINGTIPLEATLEAIRRNHRICLANKETLVAAGELIQEELKKNRGELIPVDSEQSAIFQSVGANRPQSIRKVILTASGGPFFRRKKDDFSHITVAEALAHPTWSMGTKITIDSATLMNKALEVIEAFYLFQLQKNQIDVIIHPQSIIHSMVEFIDSSVIAQLSVPDMKIPIIYSLSYPRRIPFADRRLDFADLGRLEFFEVDTETFTSIRMAYYVLEKGLNAGAVFNAANEAAVAYFLDGKISFSDIFTVVGEILYRENLYPIRSICDLDETVESIRQKTGDYIKRGRMT